MKNYIGFSRDHSGSMQHISGAAARDYNDNIAAIKEQALSTNQDTIVSVVKCGFGRPAKVVREIVNSNVQVLKPIAENDYIANGNSTPLFDSVGDLIELMESVPDANDPNVSFLVMVITDGEENSSIKWNGTSISKKIKELQATDRWTFVFRVPRGAKNALVRYGIHEGNILEWDQTTKGVEVASVATREAFRGFYAARSAGATSTDKFYTDLSNVTLKEVKATLEDISKEISVWPVQSTEDGDEIRDFVEKRIAGKMMKGAAFYQLTKTEKVQGYKQICIRDKKGMVYTGTAARNMLGLPNVGEIKLAPGSHGAFEIYVQSTSVNRKVVGGSKLLYWPNGAV